MDATCQVPWEVLQLVMKLEYVLVMLVQATVEGRMINVMTV